MRHASAQQGWARYRPMQADPVRHTDGAGRAGVGGRSGVEVGSPVGAEAGSSGGVGRGRAYRWGDGDELDVAEGGQRRQKAAGAGAYRDYGEYRGSGEIPGRAEGAKFRTGHANYRAGGIEHRTGDGKYRTDDVEHRTGDVVHPVEGVGGRTEGGAGRTGDAVHPVEGVGGRTEGGAGRAEDAAGWRGDDEQRTGGVEHLTEGVAGRAEGTEGPAEGAERRVVAEGRGREAGRLTLRERVALALGERVPTWLRLRCGVEPRTLLALAVVLLVALGFAVYHFWTGRPESVTAPAAHGPGRDAAPSAPSGSFGPGPGPSGAPGAGGPGGKRLVVDIAGKVREPGVHRLPSGARVADALEAAGGLRPGADTGGLNRARLLVDGEQIVVGEKGKGGGAPAGTASPAPPAGSAGTGSAGAAGAGGMVSLNSATAEQLEKLPGVGPVLAQHIVDYRTEHGGFRSVEQLQEVNGIGDKRFADLKSQVSP